MTNRKEQLKKLKPQIDEFEMGRNALFRVYQKNPRYLAKQLKELFAIIEPLGERDIHNKVFAEIGLLCPNNDKLLNSVARVLLTLAATTTREDIELLFVKE